LQFSTWVAEAAVLGPKINFLGPAPSERLSDQEEGFEVVNIEEERGILHMDNTPVIFLPLRDDFFVDREKDIEEWILSGITLSFGQIFTLRDQDGLERRAIPLYHTTGVKALPIAILSEGKSIRGEISDYSATLGEFTLLTKRPPGNQHNLLEAAAQLARSQIVNGPFRAGITYSLLDIFDLENYSRLYREEINSAGERVRGHGIDALATTFSHAVSQTGSRIEEVHPHGYWEQYWIGPLDPQISLSNDAMLGLYPEGRLDFRWTPTRNFYLSANTSLMLTGNPIPNAQRLKDVNSHLIIHLSLTPERPDLESELTRIAAQQSAYDAFNRTARGAPILQESGFVRSHPWAEESLAKSISQAVYSEESRAGFENELKTSPFLGDILSLKETVLRYKETYPYSIYHGDPPIRLGSYIRESDWYAGLDGETRRGLNYPLGRLDTNTYSWPREAIQCYDWTALLGKTRYPESPVYVGVIDVNNARELIPEPMRNPNGPRVLVVGGFRYLTPETLDEFETGDLFVTHLGRGHVGAVVSKKTINGEPTLLISDANRGSSGEIALFRVEKHNDYAVFGRPPLRWHVIRKV